MRKFFPISIPAGGTWPDGAQGDAPGRGLKKFNWMRWHHRSPANTAGVAIAFTAPVQNDPRSYFDLAQPGERRVRNLYSKDDPEIWPDRVYLLNLDAVNAAVLQLEVSDEPIVDLSAGAQNIGQIAGQQVAQVGVAPGALPVTLRDQLGASVNFTFPPNGGYGLPVLDTSSFVLESTTPLGASATFTGALRDCAAANWVGAKASADVAGTLFMDESDASSGSPIYQVASQASAASPAAHGTPASNSTGTEARIVPTKTLLRWVRTVYVNGATIQGAFRLNTSYSPLN